ncbi:hypothetical protein L3556_12630 [Candidatus Synechococcus calcipolaris G9]|uniref:UPF0367 protein L3556_12630 n=1 Tax=Candidatus Synechococcus calcipolaris G9 TaxID=1497997 RepID=A0ABT6F1W0_9SYNE|nr:hypothetical protein [Candidatus Synechococcus calcipolaris]MDG2991768.1 hypothetical protein [Candidatus Synechococcus calcipolaris G9]
MFTIDIVLKNVPLPLGVDRKEAEAAQALYQQLMDAMKAGSPQVMELTCDRQTDKKVAISTKEIIAVQLTDKDAGDTVTSRGGFFAQLVQQTSS